MALVLSLAATVRAQSPTASSSAMSHEVFRDWTFYHNAGWKGLATDDLKRAEYAFNHAIESARVEANTDPRLMARSYADLAWVLHRQNRDAEAEPLAKWALGVREKWFGADSMQVAQTSFTMAQIDVKLGRVDHAETLLARSLATCERNLGSTSLGTADASCDLATVQVLRRKYDRARNLYERALAIYERSNHSAQLAPLDGLATIEFAEGKLDEAEKHLTRALDIVHHDIYADPALFARLLNRQADIYRKTNRPDDAAVLESDSKTVAARPRLVRPVSSTFTPVDDPRNGWLSSIR